MQANRTSHCCTYLHYHKSCCCCSAVVLLRCRKKPLRGWRLPKFLLFTCDRAELRCKNKKLPFAPKLSPSRNQLLALAQSFTHLQGFSAASACSQQQLLQSHTPRNQHTQSNMSGWDAYVQTQLIASGAIAQGAILGKADLQLYAQEGGFEVSRQRLFTLAILGCLHCTCLSEL